MKRTILFFSTAILVALTAAGCEDGLEASFVVN